MAVLPNRRNRKRLQYWQVFYGCVLCNATALMLLGDFQKPAHAAVLYTKFTEYIKLTATTFLTAAGANAAVGAIVSGFLELIPWAVIMLAGAIVAWQAYSGYQSYERDDLSGVGKSVLNIIVLLGLLIMSSAVTDFMVGSPPAAG